MTLALDLASRGVSVLMLEREGADRAPQQRCNHISARTMEVFRRLGIASQVRDAGLPGDYPQDVAYFTALNVHELARLPIPARNLRHKAGEGYIDANWPTPEPAHRCNQMYFEPILQQQIQACTGIKIQYGVEVTDVEQDAIGVNVTGYDSTLGARSYRCNYLVARDGGKSDINKALGIRFEGGAEIARFRSVFFRAPGLVKIMANVPAWPNMVISPTWAGSIFGQRQDPGRHARRYGHIPPWQGVWLLPAHRILCAI